MLYLRRAHSPDRPPLDSNPLPTDYETRALTNAPPGLCRTNLLFLEMRRLREDLVEVLKMVRGIGNIDQCSFFQPFGEIRTRGHLLKFFLPSCRLDIRKFSFSQRDVSEWNSLSPKAVNQTSVNGFKNIIGSIFRKSKGVQMILNQLSAPVLKTPSAFFTGGIQ